MAEKIKNLCAPIPEELHAKLRQRQEESGLPLGPFMAQLITNYFESEGKTMPKENQRTIAVQVDAEMFESFKNYLKVNNVKQRDFFIAAIQQALDSMPEG